MLSHHKCHGTSSDEADVIGLNFQNQSFQSNTMIGSTKFELRLIMQCATSGLFIDLFVLKAYAGNYLLEIHKIPKVPSQKKENLSIYLSKVFRQTGKIHANRSSAIFVFLLKFETLPSIVETTCSL